MQQSAKRLVADPKLATRLLGMDRTQRPTQVTGRTTRPPASPWPRITRGITARVAVALTLSLRQPFGYQVGRLRTYLDPACYVNSPDIGAEWQVTLDAAFLCLPGQPRGGDTGVPQPGESHIRSTMG